MFIIDGERRARHAYVDASIEAVLEELEKPAMEARLGAVAVDYLTDVARTLFVPNVKHGELILPRQLNNNRIPIIALKTGEEVKVDPRATLQTPVQSEETLKRVREWFPDESEAEEMVAEFSVLRGVPRKRPFTIKQLDIHQATVNAAHRDVDITSTKIGKNPTRLLRTRPVVALSLEEGARRMTPSTVAHELEHVEQCLFTPIARADSDKDLYARRLRDELEAYDIQTFFMVAMADGGYAQAKGEVLDYHVDEAGVVFSSAAMINNLRYEVNKDRKDKYFPAGALQRALEEIGLDIV